MAQYTLLSGEQIDLSALSAEEWKHVDEVEGMIKDSKDYLGICRSVYYPLLSGKSWNSPDLRQLQASVCYRLLSDLLERYRQKLFPPG